VTDKPLSDEERAREVLGKRAYPEDIDGFVAALAAVRAETFAATKLPASAVVMTPTEWNDLVEDYDEKLPASAVVMTPTEWNDLVEDYDEKLAALRERAEAAEEALKRASSPFTPERLDEEDFRAIKLRWAFGREEHQRDADRLIAGILDLRQRLAAAERTSKMIGDPEDLSEKLAAAEVVVAAARVEAEEGPSGRTHRALCDALKTYDAMRGPAAHRVGDVWRHPRESEDARYAPMTVTELHIYDALTMSDGCGWGINELIAAGWTKDTKGSR
jgi:hypothetical protein